MSEKQEQEKQEQEKQDQEKQEPEKQPEGRKPVNIQNLIYDAVILVGIVMLAWGSYSTYAKYAGDKEDDEMYHDLSNTFLNVSTEEEEEWNFAWGGGDGSSSSVDTIWYKRVSVDFDGLNAINEDVVGWIFFENEDISYPVLYSGDNDNYLHHTLYGGQSASGSIFIEGTNNPDMQDNLTVIYGHNMKNGSMFGKLRKFKEDEGYYNSHQFFQLLSEDGKAYRYRVFAYFDIDQYEVDMVDLAFYDPEDPTTAVTEYRVVDRTTEWLELGLSDSEIAAIEPETESVITNIDNTYENYLTTIYSRSLRNTGISVTVEDKVAALFTCSATKGNRLMVFGVRVAEHDFNEIIEEEDTDIRTLDR